MVFSRTFQTISAVTPQQAIISLLFSRLWTDGCPQPLV